MIQKALFVRLDVKTGKESEVEDFLRSGLPVVQNEPGTMTWYAIKMGSSEYAIFDTFENDEGRKAHLTGQLAKLLMEKTNEFFTGPPCIEQVDVIAVKEQSDVHA